MISEEVNHIQADQEKQKSPEDPKEVYRTSRRNFIRIALGAGVVATAKMAGDTSISHPSARSEPPESSSLINSTDYSLDPNLYGVKSPHSVAAQTFNGSPTVPPDSLLPNETDPMKNTIKAKYNITLVDDSDVLHHLLEKTMRYPPQQDKELMAVPWNEKKVQEMQKILNFLPAILTDPKGADKPISLFLTDLPGLDRGFSYETDTVSYIVMTKNLLGDPAETVNGTMVNLAAAQVLGHEEAHLHGKSLKPFNEALANFYPGETFNQGLNRDMQQKTGIDPNSTKPLTEKQIETLGKEGLLSHAEIDTPGPTVIELALGGEKYFIDNLSDMLPAHTIDKLWDLVQTYVFQPSTQ